MQWLFDDIKLKISVVSDNLFWVALMEKRVQSAQIETSNTAPRLVGHDFLGDTGNTDSFRYKKTTYVIWLLCGTFSLTLT